MTSIKCVNPKCKSPKKSFDWDESKHLKKGGQIAQPHERDAVRLVVTCPFCQTDNLIWVTGAKRDTPIYRH